MQTFVYIQSYECEFSTQKFKSKMHTTEWDSHMYWYEFEMQQQKPKSTVQPLKLT